jgi:hypothetical protein
MAFGNLTVDFRQLSKIPVRDRVTLAQSPQASSIFGNLSPTEIAALFPDYYKKFIPSGSGGGASMASGMTGAGYTGGGTAPSTGGGTSGTGGATPAPTGPVVPDLIQDLYDAAGPMPGQGRKKSGSEGLKGRQQMMKMVYDGYISAGFSHKQSLAFTAEVGRENGYNSSLIFGTHTDLNGHTNAGMISMQKDRRINLFSYLQSQGLIDENGKMIQSQETINAQARFQMMEIREKYPKTAKKFLENPDISMEDAAVILGDDYIRWARKGNPRIGFSAADAARHAAGRDRYYYEIQKITENFPTEEQQGLPGTEPIDQAVPADETGIIPLEQGGTATVAPQSTAFDPAIFGQIDPRYKELYDTATDEEKRKIEWAITKNGADKLNEIAQRHPRATAEVLESGATSEAARASGITDLSKIDEIINVRYGQMGRRENKVDSALERKISAMVSDIYGPEYEAVIYSGGEPTTGKKVSKSGRHDVKFDAQGNMIGGQAADIYITHRETGKVLPRAQQIKAAQYWQAREFGGVGLGMKGGGIHLDQVQRGKAEGPDLTYRAWAYGEGDAGQRYLTKQERSALVQARSEDFDVTTITRPKPRQTIEQDSANVAQTTQTQSLPGTEAQTQTPNVNQETGSDVNILPLEQPQVQPVPNETTVTPLEQPQVQPVPNETTVTPLEQANTNMALGGTRTTDVEPNMVNEKYTITQTDPKTGETKPVANFNKEEEVNIKDGQMDVESAYKKKAQETLQKTDTGTPQANQYKMRQSTERPNDALGEQIKYGIVPRSPSFERSMNNTRFGDGHFNRGAKSQYS